MYQTFDYRLIRNKTVYKNNSPIGLYTDLKSFHKYIYTHHSQMSKSSHVSCSAELEAEELAGAVTSLEDKILSPLLLNSDIFLLFLMR